MKTSVSRNNRRQGVDYHHVIKQAYRKGYEIPLLPWQTFGIIDKPLWNSENHVIRIIPGVDKSTGQLYRQNIHCGEYAMDGDPMEYLSDTFMAANIVQFFGETKQTFITDYRPGSPEGDKYGSDTVISVFARNVRSSVLAKGKPKFGVTPEMRMWAGKNGSCRTPRFSFLMQALIFQANGRVAKDADGNELVDEAGEALPLFGVAFVDGKTTIHNLMNALVEPLDPNKPLDSLTNNKYGGLAEPEGNKLFLNSVYDQQNKFNVLRPSVQLPGKGWTPTPYPLDEEQIKSLWVPWEDVLEYMTAEEQCFHVAAEFGADAVNYLVGTDPMYRDFVIPVEIARQGYGRFSQFTDGVTTVKQTVRMAGQATPLARPALGALGSRPAPVQPKQEEPVVTQPKKPAGLSALRPNSTLDTDMLKATVAKIRAAAATPAPAADEQVEAADAILNDPGILAELNEEEE